MVESFLDSAVVSLVYLYIPITTRIMIMIMIIADDDGCIYYGMGKVFTRYISRADCSDAGF